MYLTWGARHWRHIGRHALCRADLGDVFARLMTRLLNHPAGQTAVSDEHFSADGTLIEAWGSEKSFRPKDGSGDEDGDGNLDGQTRKNDTQASTPDPDSQLYREAAGREARLSYMGKPPVKLSPDAYRYGACHRGEPPCAGVGRSGYPCHGNSRASPQS